MMSEGPYPGPKINAACSSNYSRVLTVVLDPTKASPLGLISPSISELIRALVPPYSAGVRLPGVVGMT